MSASPEGSSRAPKRTYGRVKPAATAPVDAPTMLFAAPRESPSKKLLDRFSTKSSNWRESLHDLDAPEEETEDDIKAARERFRNAKATPQGRMLVPFSSSTLTDPPSSPQPLKTAEVTDSEPEADAVSPRPLSSPPAAPPTRAARSPSASPQPSSPAQSLKAALQDDCDEDEVTTTPRIPVSRSARGSATPMRSPRPDPFEGLFDDKDEDEDEELGGSHSPRRRGKGPTKAELEEAKRDAARALRERAPQLSKPDSASRPVSAWFKKAQSAASSSVPPKDRLVPSTYTSHAGRNPDTSPAEDIRQFPTSQATPSSAIIPRSDRRSSEDQRTVVPATSSPTPAVRPRKPVLDDLDEDDEDLTLDDALRRVTAEKQQRKRWALAKQNALKAKAQTGATRDSDDDDFVIERDVKPSAGAGPSRPSVASSRQMSRMLGQASNRAATKRPGAARQKERDIPKTYARMATELVGRHNEQAHKLQQQREEKYGRSRGLPEKRELELGTIIPASASAEDSDDGDSDFAPDDGDDADLEVRSGEEDEDEAPPMPSSEQGSEDEGRESGGEDDDKENQPIVADSEDDDEDEGLAPLKKRNTKTRVAVLSDDESDREKPLQEARRQPLAPTQGGPSLSGGFGADFGAAFGDGDGEGAFSQLFAETQGAGFDEGDAFEQIRERQDAAHRIAPTAALLPSIQISESQKRRDNALIAAEFEEITPKEDEAKQQYLNSQGFFTQTRPSGLSMQPFGSATQPATNDIQPSSTLVNSSERPSDPTSPTTAEPDEEVALTRLRRRRDSPISAHSSPERPTPTRPRNAFELLNAGAARQKARDSKMRDSELIDAQAEESDDDDGWGFTAKEAEEDDDEDDIVTGLVDDAEIADELREQQDALVTEKARAVAAEDDARREAEAKKVVDGHYRIKRRGNEFLSDEEDEAGPRLSKKARRQRHIDREDGLFKLGGEANVFLEAYNQDLESDNEFDEAPPSPGLVTSPILNLSAKERDALLKQRARMNTDPTEVLRMDEEDDVRDFAISRASRPTLVQSDEDGVRVPLFAALRSAESYSKFVSEQAANPRGTGGGVSVVGHGTAKPVPKRSASTASTASAGQSSSRSLGGSGSVLFRRGNRFG